MRVGANPDGEQLVDLIAGTVEINATVVPVAGRGLIVQQWPKTAAGWRRLALPPGVAGMIDRQRGQQRLTHRTASSSEPRAATCATRATPRVICARSPTVSLAHAALGTAGYSVRKRPGTAHPDLARRRPARPWAPVVHVGLLPPRTSTWAARW